MKAFHSIRSEMRATCSSLTDPARGQPAPPMTRGGTEDETDDIDTHIEPWMEVAFKGLTHASETDEPYALISCFMNGKPAALIAATHPEGTRTHVLPLFLAVQPWMKFSGQPGEEGGDSDDGGGRWRDEADGPSPG
jgi:hypothetical protein